MNAPCDCGVTGAAMWQDLPPSDRAFLRTTGLVRLSEAARRLGMSPASLRRHVHEGRCTGRKFDGEWFIGHATVERLCVRRRMRLRA